METSSWVKTGLTSDSYKEDIQIETTFTIFRILLTFFGFLIIYIILYKSSFVTTKDISNVC